MIEESQNPLDGFRGIRPPQLQRARAVVKDKPSVYARYILGVQAEKLMAGLAEVEDVASVMKAVIDRAESDIREAARQLAGLPDVRSEDAVKAHALARTASCTLTYLNDLVRDGNRAAEAIEEEGGL